MKRLAFISAIVISAMCIFLLIGAADGNAAENGSGAACRPTEKTKAKENGTDAIKAMRDKTKYNKKISMYDGASKKDYTGEWHLILSDGNNHGTLIIKKIGDTYYAELFGENHWKGVGYAYKEMLLFSFKYTNESDAGFVTFRLKTPHELESRSIDYDGTFRWQGVLTRPK